MKPTLCLLALLPLVLAQPLEAATKKPASTQTIPAEEKATNKSYGLVVLVPQTFIETSFDIGRVASAPSGGLLDTLIVQSMDNKREIMANSQKEKAEQIAKPLREALAGFDVETEAVGWTENAITKVPWIDHKSTTWSKSPPPAIASPRIAQIRYSYDVSPDFSAIRLFTEVDLSREGVTKDGKGTGKFTSFYGQSITSIVQLRKRSYEASENVAAWSADNGKQAKAALEQAFASIQQLLPYALELSPADIKAFSAKDREQGFAAGYNGPLIKRGGGIADDMLIWNKGLLFVHTLP
jgi:hypothetical protein